MKRNFTWVSEVHAAQKYRWLKAPVVTKQPAGARDVILLNGTLELDRLYTHFCM
jgi:hypothetical protein